MSFEKNFITFDQLPPSSTTDRPPGDVERGVSRALGATDELPAISAYSSFTAVDDLESVSDFSIRTRAARYFQEQVDTERSDLLLIACSFISGVIDSAAFNAWGSFASMQTGNVVFLALGVSGQPPEPRFRWAKSLIAIATFISAVLFFTHASRLLGPLRRSTLLASFMLQTGSILASSILVETGIIDSEISSSIHGVHWLQMVPITLLAFQAAGQIVTSRMVQVEEIPTVVLTTVLADLFIDPRLLAKTNLVRNRRGATVLALFGGAMLSGALTKAIGLSCSLWLAAGIKGVITICWALWRPKANVAGSRRCWP
ncbi:domain containing protein [Coccidioides immitis RMSCC 2394]|uniref:Domain containing protein n=1 Tax=Coccidioides immitis RMSCC 2394 TaxID=404692 RepID=A0A0J6YD37_COCIT|nr:domain containing protein [Coccidioides immitis RMSCC 2394]